MNIKFALKAAAFATTLVVSTLSLAADADPYSHVINDGDQIVDVGHLFRNNDKSMLQQQGIGIYDMTNLNKASQSFLAFCIEPTVDLVGTAQYYANYNTNLLGTFSADQVKGIKALYETSFKTLDSHESKMAFQLALWDISADDGSIYAPTGIQYFSSTEEGEPVALADGMLTRAKAYLASGGTLNTYTYTTFTAQDSQTLLGASITAAVPEVETWAMLVAGLGLVGFMGRRRSGKTGKITA
ncbi:hypothetical protein KW842_01615 [Duganella sp. sic0402]|uniref:PEP-CTERM sorting domain-containing protein n=1 Tax=Duganella sp. sic0402 TaxID=2854786 RepID=UPI001C444E48|nr:PEP-CTERM sorting domain-containing protein [Duganella sp. sic0402]MBV7534454.1 hypothetical protein [Duganella sp. sic0402]